MPGVTVRFTNVGPGHRSWDSHIPELTEEELYRAVRRSRALGSRGIDFTEDEEGNRGGIYVGIFRRVGNWQVLA